MEEKHFLENLELEEHIKRIDSMLEDKDPANEQLSLILGSRLALEMTLELKQGKPLGTQSGDLVLKWNEEYGAQAVEDVVSVARSFLTKPEELKKGLEKRLFES
jgi:hypothetical protein